MSTRETQPKKRTPARGGLMMRDPVGQWTGPYSTVQDAMRYADDPETTTGVGTYRIQSGFNLVLAHSVFVDPGASAPEGEAGVAI